MPCGWKPRVGNCEKTCLVLAGAARMGRLPLPAIVAEAQHAAQGPQ